MNAGIWEKEAYVTVRDKAGSGALRKQMSVPCYGSGNYSLNMSLVKMVYLGPNYLWSYGLLKKPRHDTGAS